MNNHINDQLSQSEIKELFENIEIIQSLDEIEDEDLWNQNVDLQKEAQNG